MTVMLLVGGICLVGTDEASAASSVVIGHAATGESGLTGQKPGDQTGKEVYTMDWVYSSSTTSSRHWMVVIRCNDRKKAKKMAKTMIDACNNPHVGYDKGSFAQRESFFEALKEAGWDASKITKDVETSCTPLIGACINAAGIEIMPDRSATSLYNLLKKDARFTCFTTKDYTRSDARLLVGDILLSTIHQHGAMVVKSPITEDQIDVYDPEKDPTANAESPFIVGNQYLNVVDLRIRKGPGINYNIKKRTDIKKSGRDNLVEGDYAVLKTGVKVKCLATSGNWINTSYGWICGQENKDVYIKDYSETLEADLQKQVAEAEAKAAAAKAAAEKEAARKEAEAKKAAEKAAKQAAEKAAKEAAEKAKQAKKEAEQAAKKNAQKVTFKKGKDYVTAVPLKVRKGPGTNFAIKKRSELTSNAKQFAEDGWYAVLKEGTTVTCLEISGEWMKIPSGWICCSNGYIKNAAADKASTTKKSSSKTKSSKKVKVQVGKDYKITRALYVRKGPGTKYAIKKRSKLSANAKLFACKGTKARLKKNTVVTCLKVKGNWMKIPSGWIRCKNGYVKMA